MTLEMFISIGKKYALLEYCDYNECFYLKGCIDNEMYRITAFKGAPTGGLACTYCDCEIDSDNHIFTENKYYSSLDPEGYEQQLKLFIRNYKKAQIEIKKKELNKDFTNEY